MANLMVKRLQQHRRVAMLLRDRQAEASFAPSTPAESFGVQRPGGPISAELSSPPVQQSPPSTPAATHSTPSVQAARVNTATAPPTAQRNFLQRAWDGVRGALRPQSAAPSNPSSSAQRRSTSSTPRAPQTINRQPQQMATAPQRNDPSFAAPVTPYAAQPQTAPPAVRSAQPIVSRAPAPANAITTPANRPMVQSAPQRPSAAFAQPVSLPSIQPARQPQPTAAAQSFPSASQPRFEPSHQPQSLHAPALQRTVSRTFAQPLTPSRQAAPTSTPAQPLTPSRQAAPTWTPAQPLQAERLPVQSPAQPAQPLQQWHPARSQPLQQTAAQSGYVPQPAGPNTPQPNADFGPLQRQFAPPPPYQAAAPQQKAQAMQPAPSAFAPQLTRPNTAPQMAQSALSQQPIAQNNSQLVRPMMPPQGITPSAGPMTAHGPSIQRQTQPVYNEGLGASAQPPYAASSSGSRLVRPLIQTPTTQIVQSKSAPTHSIPLQQQAQSAPSAAITAPHSTYNNRNSQSPNAQSVAPTWAQPAYPLQPTAPTGQVPSTATAQLNRYAEPQTGTRSIVQTKPAFAPVGSPQPQPTFTQLRWPVHPTAQTALGDSVSSIQPTATAPPRNFPAPVVAQPVSPAVAAQRSGSSLVQPMMQPATHAAPPLPTGVHAVAPTTQATTAASMVARSARPADGQRLSAQTDPTVATSARSAPAQHSNQPTTRKSAIEAAIQRAEQPTSALSASRQSAIEAAIQRAEQPTSSQAAARQNAIEAAIQRAEQPTSSQAASRQSAIEAAIQRAEQPASSQAASRQSAIEAAIQRAEQPASSQAAARQIAIEAAVQRAEQPISSQAAARQIAIEAAIQRAEQPTSAPSASHQNTIEAAIQRAEQPTSAPSASRQIAIEAAIQRAEQPTFSQAAPRQSTIEAAIQRAAVQRAEQPEPPTSQPSGPTAESPAAQRLSSITPATAPTPPTAIGQGSTGTVEAQPQQPPLQAVWPVEVETESLIARLENPTIVEPRRPDTMQDQQIQSILQRVETQPTTTAPELVAPRRRRPQRPPKPPVQRQSAETVQRSPDQPPKTIQTEIGDLPADLWDLVGQPVPTEPAPIMFTPPAQAERIQRTPTDNSGPAIQRAAAAPQQPDTGEPGGNVNERADAQGETEVNLDEIAQQVYQQLKRRLTIEYERQYRR